MSVIINYKKPPNKSSANIILFVEDNFNLQNIKKVNIMIGTVIPGMNHILLKKILKIQVMVKLENYQ